MYALAVHMLIVTTLRIKNLTSLETERHFVRTRLGPDAVVHLVIPEDEIKNGEPYERALPNRTIELMEEYLERYRPRVCEPSSPWLFPNDQGSARPRRAFRRRSPNSFCAKPA